MAIPDRIAGMMNLAILQALCEEGDWSQNERNLEIILRHMGHKPTTAQLRDALRFLEEGKMIEIEKMPRDGGQELWKAKVTELGQRVTKGFERREGVARPGEI